MTTSQPAQATATVTPITEAPKATATRSRSRASRAADTTAKATPKAAPKATAKATPKATAPKATAPKAAPIVISAPKGGTQTVSPKRGAVAKAIKATGLSIQAIARQHHQNPSQLRRLSLDQVAKVDLVRAESIAAALGVKVEVLFGAAEDKAKATPKRPPVRPPPRRPPARPPPRPRPSSPPPPRPGNRPQDQPAPTGRASCLCPGRPRPRG